VAIIQFNMIRASLILSVSLLPAAAQAPASQPLKAPEGVEKALRGRADEFYQLQIDGKFRASERLVCESSQEAYYLASKRKWLSKEIVRVDFDEGFKSAKVSILLGTEAMMPLGVIRLKSVVPTAWKLEEGGWCFHIPESDQKEIVTPFGKMSSAPAGPQGASIAPPTAPNIDPKMVMTAVAVTRSELRVKGYEVSADEVEVVNRLAGAVELRLSAPQIPGLKVTLSATRLGRNEKAQVKATYAPADRSPKPADKIIIRVIPTGQVLGLALVFESPAGTTGKLPVSAPPKQDD
jgi:hypothetical protein